MSTLRPKAKRLRRLPSKLTLCVPSIPDSNAAGGKMDLSQQTQTKPEPCTSWVVSQWLDGPETGAWRAKGG